MTTLHYDKQLGQHHLRSPEVAEAMLSRLQPANRLVVEIGPGGGALTRELVERGAKVVAVELDLRWAVTAARVVPAATLCVADALHFDWQRLPEDSRVAGNLPYNVATALIERIFEQAPRGTRLGFLVQLEVAQRIVAVPRSKAYGSFSVLAQTRGSWDQLNTVKPGSFHPPPKVHSAFVVGLLEALPDPLDEVDERWESYERFVRACFAQRRKTLLNSLRRTGALGVEAAAATRRSEALRRALRDLGYDDRCRAEEIAAAHYVQLWQEVAQIGT